VFPISLVLPELPPIKIVDVGAMAAGEDPYQRLAEQLACEVVGFDAQEEECRKLNAAAAPGRTFLPYVIGDGSPQTFYECAARHSSSLLEPNRELLEHFTGFAEMLRVVAQQPVSTRRLDDIPQAAGTDFLKLDVQGGELMVLEGAPRMLRDVLVVHTEVEFVPLYRRQPLFPDIDLRLRSHGFVLHKMPFLGVRPFAPFPVEVERANQYLWADAVYVRDFMAFEALAPAQLLKLAAILHANYDSFDFASAALGAYDRKTGGGLQQEYLSYLNAP
jgi:FkbM family methyltransferase